MREFRNALISFTLAVLFGFVCVIFMDYIYDYTIQFFDVVNGRDGRFAFSLITVIALIAVIGMSLEEYNKARVIVKTKIFRKMDEMMYTHNKEFYEKFIATYYSAPDTYENGYDLEVVDGKLCYCFHAVDINCCESVVVYDQVNAIKWLINNGYEI